MEKTGGKRETTQNSKDEIWGKREQKEKPNGSTTKAVTTGEIASRAHIAKELTINFMTQLLLLGEFLIYDKYYNVLFQTVPARLLFWLVSLVTGLQIIIYSVNIYLDLIKPEWRLDETLKKLRR